MVPKLPERRLFHLITERHEVRGDHTEVTERATAREAGADDERPMKMQAGRTRCNRLFSVRAPLLRFSVAYR